MNNDDQQKKILLQFVTFNIDTEEYGVEILQVQEVIRLPELTKLPNAPQFIKGVIDLRGDIIPIVDLREKFNLSVNYYNETTRVIIVEFNDKKIGIIVDYVSQVVRIPETNIIPPPPTIVGIESKMILGVAKLESRLIILLKIDEIFSTEEIVTLHSIDKIDDAA